MNEYLPTSTANGLPHNLQRGERLASIGAGLVLAGFGLARGGLPGACKAVAGGLLVSRGLSGHCHVKGLLNEPREELQLLREEVQHLTRRLQRLQERQRDDSRRTLRWTPSCRRTCRDSHGPCAWRRAHRREEGETMASQLFLISYILDDQPMTCELHSEAETLSREEARRHLEALHRPHDAEAISDIQVSKVERTHEPGTTPGHYQQP